MMLTANIVPGVLRFLILSTVLAILATPAMADAIDGDWCAKIGRHLNIDGANLKTPGGNNIIGDYDRHGFTYVVPKGEVHASKTIHMQMQSEQLMLLTLPGGSVEKWNRCEVVS
jgi:hypothetical protein